MTLLSGPGFAVSLHAIQIGVSRSVSATPLLLFQGSGHTHVRPAVSAIESTILVVFQIES